MRVSAWVKLLHSGMGVSHLPYLFGQPPARKKVVLELGTLGKLNLESEVRILTFLWGSTQPRYMPIFSKGDANRLEIGYRTKSSYGGGACWRVEVRILASPFKHLIVFELYSFIHP